jgi:hypothetical protein
MEYWSSGTGKNWSNGVMKKQVAGFDVSFQYSITPTGKEAR